jgi:hypothetical protein
MLSIPSPDDTELIAEAFFVAMINDRIAVLDYMIDRGFPIDYLEWEMPFVSFAAGNQRMRVVECLVRRGANLDLRGRHPDVSAREMARERFEAMPTDPTARRILELCGVDPERVIADMRARPVAEPGVASKLREALELAGDDAARRDQADIHPENLLIGMLRTAPAPSLAMQVMQHAGVDLERLRAAIGDRVLPSADRLQRTALPLDTAAQDVMCAAIAIARARRRELVTTPHALRALADTEDAFLCDLLTRCGSNLARFAERLGENAL